MKVLTDVGNDDENCGDYDNEYLIPWCASTQQNIKYKNINY